MYFWKYLRNEKRYFDETFFDLYLIKKHFYVSKYIFFYFYPFTCYGIDKKLIFW